MTWRKLEESKERQGWDGGIGSGTRTDAAAGWGAGTDDRPSELGFPPPLCQFFYSSPQRLAPSLNLI